SFCGTHKRTIGDSYSSEGTVRYTASWLTSHGGARSLATVSCRVAVLASLFCGSPEGFASRTLGCDLATIPLLNSYIRLPKSTTGSVRVANADVPGGSALGPRGSSILFHKPKRAMLLEELRNLQHVFDRASATCGPRSVLLNRPRVDACGALCVEL